MTTKVPNNIKEELIHDAMVVRDGGIPETLPPAYYRLFKNVVQWLKPILDWKVAEAVPKPAPPPTSKYQINAPCGCHPHDWHTTSVASVGARAMFAMPKKHEIVPKNPYPEFRFYECRVCRAFWVEDRR